MGKLICMGDCIADMLPDGAGSLTYTAKMGGAPANVCVAAAKLGVQACFLGKLADDAFGRFLLAELKSYGVDTSLTVIDKHCKTGLAFVALSSDGDREFFFYRDTPADASLSPDEVKETMFGRDDVLHFCSISLKPSPTCDAIRKAAETARKKGATVSFDVNLRLNLWDNDETALRRTVFEFFPYADIIKVTDEELPLPGLPFIRATSPAEIIPRCRAKPWTPRVRATALWAVSCTIFLTAVFRSPWTARTRR